MSGIRDWTEEAECTKDEPDQKEDDPLEDEGGKQDEVVRWNTSFPEAATDAMGSTPNKNIPKKDPKAGRRRGERLEHEDTEGKARQQS